MFKIVDGREHFYQWDLNRQIQVEDSTITQLHFCNRTEDCALIVDVVDGVADVPNILLQSTWDIRVYGYTGDYTKLEKRYKVVARSKPDNYIYEETKIKNYEDLELRHKQDIVRLEGGLSTTSKNATMAQQAADTAQQIAVNAGQTAYAVKQTLDYVIEPNLASHEERITDLETGSKKTLVVYVQNGVPSHEAAYIYNYVCDGGNVMLLTEDDVYLALTSVGDDTATFNYIGDDYVGYQYTIFNGEAYITDLEYAQAEQFNILQETVGNIENALAEITALQASYIGGAE